jgi:hypothetical protein
MQAPLSKPVRSATAFAVGAVVYLAILYRGLSYTERNHLSSTSYLVFAAVLLGMGFVLALGLDRGRYRIASWIIAGIWAGHMFVVSRDWRVDPTDHNLLPFEFIILAVVASPVYIGAALARAAGWMGRS